MRAKLVGGNIIDHWDHMVALRHAADIYFHFDCAFVKALENYLVREDQVLIEKPDHIVSYRGQGPGININLFDIVTFNGTSLITFDVAIDFWRDSGHDPPFGCLYAEDSIYTIDRKYKITAPSDLVCNFTEEEFQKWLQEEDKKKKEASFEQVCNVMKAHGISLEALVNYVGRTST